MKNTPLKQRTINLAVVALVTLFGGCATTASPGVENVLLSAGFKAKVATTAKQRQELQTLPEGKISAVRQKGKTFYIYPDAPHNQIYVGNKAQYQAYKKLAAQEPTGPGPIQFEAYAPGGNVNVREFYGWAPFDEF
jgi:PBP1b-binding outer membrane lipoprotein LpoB